MDKSGFVNKMISILRAGEKKSRPQIEKIANSFGANGEKILAKEYLELAIVKYAREIANESGSDLEKYRRIVKLYFSQANLSLRTSLSTILQQYSTPAPIGFLAGYFSRVSELSKAGSAFEPSAGNGLLTIASKERIWDVNEIDSLRYENLSESQSFHQVTKYDASNPFTQKEYAGKQYEVVITNPPFGSLGEKIDVEGWPISELDHIMTIYALDKLKDNGRAAIIIGGHTPYRNGQIQRGKNSYFLHFLYSQYNVVDVIPIVGKSLYSRQGTSYDTRMILIAGRKKSPEGLAPLWDEEMNTPVDDFNALFNRVELARNHADRILEKSDSDRLKMLALVRLKLQKQRMRLKK